MTSKVTEWWNSNSVPQRRCQMVQFWCGLVYRQIGNNYETNETFTGTWQSLYFRAVVVAGTIDQNCKVEIYWLGHKTGELQGLC